MLRSHFGHSNETNAGRDSYTQWIKHTYRYMHTFGYTLRRNADGLHSFFFCFFCSLSFSLSVVSFFCSFHCMLGAHELLLLHNFLNNHSKPFLLAEYAKEIESYAPVHQLPPVRRRRYWIDCDMRYVYVWETGKSDQESENQTTKYVGH